MDKIYLNKYILSYNDILNILYYLEKNSNKKLTRENTNCYTTFNYKIETFKIDPEKIKDVIGRGGEMITKIICEASNVTEVNNINAVKVDLEDDGRVIIYHTDKEIIEKTRKMIEDIVKEIEVGKIYNAKVVKVEDFGCFVELWPGCEGLVHVSELDYKRVDKPRDMVSVGDKIIVKALGYDNRGRLNLSRKQALPKMDNKEEKKKK